MQHLRDNCMSYYEHFIFSFTLGINFLLAAGASFAHALIPSLYTTYASDTVRDLSRRLKNSGCPDKD